MSDIIRDIEKNKTDSIRVSIDEYKGHTYVQLRIWFSHDGDELKPTAKGVTIPPKRLQEVIEALTEAKEKLDAKGEAVETT